MRSTKLAMEQYVAEFPFLRPWVHPDFPPADIEFPEGASISVQRLDAINLDSRPEKESTFYFWFLWRRFFLISKDGSILREVRTPTRSLWNPFTWFGKSSSGATILEEILSLGSRASEIGWVVEVDDTQRGCLVTFQGRNITVYKLPKGILFVDFLAQARARIQEAVRQRIAEESAAAEEEK